MSAIPMSPSPDSNSPGPEELGTAWQFLEGTDPLDQDIRVPAHRAIGGATIGILAIDASYPMFPGNVVNATTYKFPVLYGVLEGIEYDRIAAADPGVLEPLVTEAKRLISLGARAIVGACGSFANYQRQATEALDVPTFMSIMMHVPLLARSLRSDQKVGVICAHESVITNRVLDEVGIDDPSVMVLRGADASAEFRRMMEGDGALNPKQLEREMAILAHDFVKDHPEIGVLLLQCSDLPPHAAAIQRATGRSVFDMTTMIEWLQWSLMRQPYRGWL